MYPIDVGYCFTVHKAQGDTLKDGAFIDIKNYFADGQLYTALSRLEGGENLYLFDFTDEDLYKSYKTNNLVLQLFKSKFNEFEKLKENIDSKYKDVNI